MVIPAVATSIEAVSKIRSRVRWALSPSGKVYGLYGERQRVSYGSSTSLLTLTGDCHAREESPEDRTQEGCVQEEAKEAPPARRRQTSLGASSVSPRPAPAAVRSGLAALFPRTHAGTAHVPEARARRGRRSRPARQGSTLEER